jgi:hypothetical protein
LESEAKYFLSESLANQNTDIDQTINHMIAYQLSFISKGLSTEFSDSKKFQKSTILKIQRCLHDLYLKNMFLGIPDKKKQK